MEVIYTNIHNYPFKYYTAFCIVFFCNVMQSQAVIKKNSKLTKVHNWYVKCTYVVVVVPQYGLMPKILSLLITLFFEARAGDIGIFRDVPFALLVFLLKNVKMSFGLITANKSSVEALYISV